MEPPACGTNEHGPVAPGRLYAAVDVQYLEDQTARAALVAAVDPQFRVLAGTRTVTVAQSAPYQSGALYLRELPPLRAVLQQAQGLGLIVVDGYADLDPGGTPGLGAHVHAEFGVPVVGVAKTAYRTATHAALVRRGRSRGRAGSGESLTISRGLAPDSPVSSAGNR